MPRFVRQPDSWPRKFGLAIRGLVWACRAERSFAIHLSATAAVIVAAAALGASLIEWSILILCIAVVLAAEMFNTALERMARVITPEENDDIRNALDAASGAVLVAAIGAAVAGGAILLVRLGIALGYWS
jgi:diacylglycerol kinase